MLPLDVHLHPSEAAISHAVVDVRVGGVHASQSVMAARVKYLPAFAHDAVDEGAEYCWKHGKQKQEEEEEKSMLCDE